MTEFLLRIFIASLLGGLIGLEREYRAKEAGMRTHFLVALGSALFMILSQYGFDDVINASPNISMDPSRIASQVVTGIGFIGAGTIILQKHVVKGLTTAAGLWVTSAIGLTCGTGLYSLATAATLLVLICLELFNLLLLHFGHRNINLAFRTETQQQALDILQQFGEEGIEFDNYDMRQHHNHGHEEFVVDVELRVKRKEYQQHILQLIRRLDGVRIDNIE